MDMTCSLHNSAFHLDASVRQELAASTYAEEDTWVKDVRTWRCWTNRKICLRFRLYHLCFVDIVYPGWGNLQLKCDQARVMNAWLLHVLRKLLYQTTGCIQMSGTLLCGDFKTLTVGICWRFHWNSSAHAHQSLFKALPVAMTQASMRRSKFSLTEVMESAGIRLQWRSI